MRLTPRFKPREAPIDLAKSLGLPPLTREDYDIFGGGGCSERAARKTREELWRIERWAQTGVEPPPVDRIERFFWRIRKRFEVPQ